MSIDLHLCALDPAMGRAWAVHFGSQPNVHIHEADILEKKADAIISPANSFGFMDGGIDLADSYFFGCPSSALLGKCMLHTPRWF